MKIYAPQKLRFISAFLVILGSALPYINHAQIGFKNIYDSMGPEPSEYSSIIVENDTIFGLAYGAISPTITLTDSNGILLQHDYINTEEGGILIERKHEIAKSGNHIFAAGTAINQPDKFTFLADYNYKTRTYELHFYPNNDVTEPQTITDVIIVEDGYFLIGSVLTSSFLFQTQIIFLDKNFNEVWREKYGGTNNALYGSSAISGPNSILIGATSGRNIWIFEVDTSGSTIWDWESNFIEDSLSFMPYGLTLAENNKLIYTCNKRHVNSFGQSRSLIAIVQIDTISDKIDWISEYGHIENEVQVLYSIQKVWDGYVATGRLRDTVVENNIDVEFFCGWTHKVFKNGEKAWSRIDTMTWLEGFGCWTEMYDIAQFSSGSLILAGWSGVSFGDANPALIKLSGSGCLTEPCDNTTSVNETPIGTATIYPNPAQNHITIDWDPVYSYDIRISDLSGKTILVSTGHSDKTTLDTSGFNPGLYFVTITSINGYLTKKFITQ